MAWKNIIPNGTRVKFKGLRDKEWIIGVIDDNDEENTERYKNLNYYVYPTERKKEFLDYYGSPYVLLLRRDFKIIKEV